MPPNGALLADKRGPAFGNLSWQSGYYVLPLSVCFWALGGVDTVTLLGPK